jgi:hypothetical protein
MGGVLTVAAGSAGDQCRSDCAETCNQRRIWSNANAEGVSGLQGQRLWRVGFYFDNEWWRPFSAIFAIGTGTAWQQRPFGEAVDMDAGDQMVGCIPASEHEGPVHLEKFQTSFATGSVHNRRWCVARASGPRFWIGCENGLRTNETVGTALRPNVINHARDQIPAQDSVLVLRKMLV